MNILSIVGLIVGIDAILAGITLKGGEISLWLNLPAFLICNENVSVYHGEKLC
ncbi:MAG: hypothetical protein WCJ11_07500 [Methylococcaceae bacterium]